MRKSEKDKANTLRCALRAIRNRNSRWISAPALADSGDAGAALRLPRAAAEATVVTIITRLQPHVRPSHSRPARV